MERRQFSFRTLLANLPPPLLPPPLSSPPLLAPPPAKSGRAKKKTEKSQPQPKSKPYKKQKISAALREQVWVQRNGRIFETKCMVTWCKNTVTVFDFQCGHDIPESKGGPTDITNLYPICGKCNLSMSNTYTFQEWCKLYTAVADPQSLLPAPPLPPPPPPSPPSKSGLSRFFKCFGKQQHPISTSGTSTSSSRLT